METGSEYNENESYEYEYKYIDDIGYEDLDPIIKESLEVKLTF